MNTGDKNKIATALNVCLAEWQLGADKKGHSAP